jgi:hypothetical protein
MGKTYVKIYISQEALVEGTFIILLYKLLVRKGAVNAYVLQPDTTEYPIAKAVLFTA